MKWNFLVQQDRSDYVRIENRKDKVFLMLLWGSTIILFIWSLFSPMMMMLTAIFLIGSVLFTIYYAIRILFRNYIYG
jgi:hypothetical protein